MSKNFKYLKVGGCVRDGLLGRHSKDIDYVVVPRRLMPPGQAYRALARDLKEEGIKIYLEKPECLTIRGRYKGEDVDFVLARCDVAYQEDSRTPQTRVGTLEEDLSRRDFTMNAIAITEKGNYIDLFGGMADVKRRIIRCTQSPEVSFYDDPLRLLRAFRFAVQLDFDFDYAIERFLLYQAGSKAFSAVFHKKITSGRIMKEANKMFSAGTMQTFELLLMYPNVARLVLSRPKLRLALTDKKFKGNG